VATLTLEEYEAWLQDLVDGSMRPALDRVLHETALVGEANLKGNISQRLNTRSARLIRSAQGDVVGGDHPGVVLRAGGPGRSIPYAKAQESGATVSPVNGRYLTIPFPGGPALTGAGVPRYPNARAAGPLQLFKAKSGRLMLGKRVGQGSSARMQAWYILHPGPITIRGKHYMRDAAKTTSEHMTRRLSELLEATLENPEPTG
jgi:hypothetical protein